MCSTSSSFGFAVSSLANQFGVIRRPIQPSTAQEVNKRLEENDLRPIGFGYYGFDNSFVKLLLFSNSGIEVIVFRAVISRPPGTRLGPRRSWSASSVLFETENNSTIEMFFEDASQPAKTTARPLVCFLPLVVMDDVISITHSLALSLQPLHPGVQI